MMQLKGIIEGLNTYYQQKTNRKGQFILQKRIDPNLVIPTIKSLKAIIHFVNEDINKPVLSCTYSQRVVTEEEVTQADIMITQLVTFNLLEYITSKEFKELL